MTVENTEQNLKQLFSLKGEKLSVTGYLSDDQMKLFVDIERTGDWPSPSEVIQLISSYISKDQIDLQALHNMCDSLRKEHVIKHRRLAKGQPPVNGEDGRLELCVTPFNLTSSNGSGKLFDNIEIETVVGKLHYPTSGEEGCDALGKPLRPTPGKPLDIKVDESIKMDYADEVTGISVLQAQRAGCLFLEGKQAKILEKILLPEVSRHTGDIEFLGSVEVQADVLTDCRLTAHKNIILQGNLYRGYLNSVGGSIEIRGSALGQGIDIGAVVAVAQNTATLDAVRVTTPQVVAAADISLAVAENCSMSAGGNIIVCGEAKNCHLRAYGNLTGPKSHIFGGYVCASKNMELGHVGNQAGVVTLLHLASSVESSQKFQELLSEIHQLEEVEKGLALHLGPFINGSSASDISGLQRAKLQKLIVEYKNICHHKQELEKARDSMLSDDSTEDQQVNILHTLHPGSYIRSGKNTYCVTEVIHGPKTISFDRSNNCFKVTDLRKLPESESTTQES